MAQAAHGARPDGSGGFDVTGALLGELFDIWPGVFGWVCGVDFCPLYDRAGNFV